MYGKLLTGVSVDEHFPISPEMVHLFKYAPLTSVDVERSFSSLKNVFSYRRHNFKETKLEKYIIAYEEFVFLTLYILYLYDLSF